MIMGLKLKIKAALNKLEHLSPKSIIVIVIVLVVMVGASVGFYVYQTSKSQNQDAVADCLKLVNDSYALLRKNDSGQDKGSEKKDDANQTESLSNDNSNAKQAYDLIYKEAGRCTQSKDGSIESQINVLTYNVALADAAYASGDKLQAYKYADIAAKQYSAIPEGSRHTSGIPLQIESTILNILENQRVEQMSKEGAR